MAYTVESHCLWVGSDNNYEKVLGLHSDLIIEPEPIIVNSQSVLALPIVPLSAGDYLSRLTEILKSTVCTLDIDWLSAPILVLLPQLGTVDQSQHQALYPYLCQAIPALAAHTHCYLYPYGRSAMLLAWQQIERLLSQECHSGVWVLALDSDPRLSSLPFSTACLQDVEDGIVASESVIALKVFTSASGLIRPWLSYEARTRDKAATAAVMALFQRYQHACGQPIHQFYAPYDGGRGSAEEWAGAYQHLHGCVGEFTQIVMSGALTGELGACSGLYNLLHLYARYQRGEYQLPTLQLEISEKLYRGAALYAWQP
ncbi:hypothetical protein ABT56_18235 [Photobacterium aquae]|uniref:Uncharacterized protein n=1 Tax=Photobacterium aquae TaxID=1195763 RepID=A0A0J1GVM6_9GAMM|nr:hypothetical protein [Photobacterium aquae]KLV03743.1 hypothetical protein ABT56_18235 [Photobacterium aquae]